MRQNRFDAPNTTFSGKSRKKSDFLYALPSPPIARVSPLTFSPGHFRAQHLAFSRHYFHRLTGQQRQRAERSGHFRLRFAKDLHPGGKFRLSNIAATALIDSQFSIPIVLPVCHVFRSGFPVPFADRVGSPESTIS